jgi:hypothetical protein
MCQAIATAGGHLADWVNAHPDSFPPIVINITDGVVTDSPFQGASINEWAERLRTLKTNDGPALLFNVFLSPQPAPPALFPVTAANLPDPGPALFGISSELPPPMIQLAAKDGINVEQGARGFGFNADMATLSRFLDIGTQGAARAVQDG